MLIVDAIKEFPRWHHHDCHMVWIQFIDQKQLRIRINNSGSAYTTTP